MSGLLYLTAQIGFVVLTLVYITLFIKEIHKGLTLTSWANPRKKRFLYRIIICFILWGGFLSIWSISGNMSEFANFPFNLVPVLLIPLLTAVVFISSSSISKILKHIPQDNLIRLQSFRFFVEILLWLLFIDNLLPVQMTFEGRNFDILAGISAPVIAYLAVRGKISKGGLIFWNVICLGLLLNIVITAILSTPSPWRVFMNEPANYIVTYFPVSLLPGFLVPLAYFLHFFSLKQLTQKTANITKVPPLNTARSQK